MVVELKCVSILVRRVGPRENVAVSKAVEVLCEVRFAGGLDLVQVAVGIHGGILDLDHAHSNVGAVVSNSLTVVKCRNTNCSD